MRAWQDAWLQSDVEFKRNNPTEALTHRRLVLHCHATASRAESGFSLLREFEPIVAHGTVFAKCPTWMLGAAPSSGDEADSIDAAISPARIEHVRSARTRLIASLSKAQQTLPGDPWILGQLVRFAVDAGDNALAVGAVGACHIDRWWCSALAGYVFAAQHDVAQAASFFHIAEGAIADSSKCAWTDITLLVPAQARGDYASRRCAVRDTLAKQYWWLAAPFWSDGINDREVEHYRRKMIIMLHSALRTDEKYRWNADEGGGIVAEMLLRYGWPSVALNLGGIDDGGHDSYLRVGRSAPSSPFSTAEYSSGRPQFAVS